MARIDVGDTSIAAPDLIMVAVNPGDTVNLSNVAGGTLNYFTNGIDQAPTTLTAGNNVNVTVPTYISSPGAITTVQITGGMYGAV